MGFILAGYKVLYSLSSLLYISSVFNSFGLICRYTLAGIISVVSISVPPSTLWMCIKLPPCSLYWNVELTVFATSFFPSLVFSHCSRWHHHESSYLCQKARSQNWHLPFTSDIQLIVMSYHFILWNKRFIQITVSLLKVYLSPSPYLLFPAHCNSLLKDLSSTP